ncbi:MAG: sigma-70 family RNA polymerase sigma factor [Bacteroidota bacterium]
MQTSGNQKDLSQLEALYSQYYQSLYDYGFGLCQNKTLTKDCIQELFLTLCEKPDLIGSIQHNRNYLRVSLKRSILKKAKAERRQLSMEVSEVADISIPSYEEMLINAQDNLRHKIRLKNTFSKLSLSQKTILTMRFYKGMSYEEIADQLGIAKRTVYNQIHEAIKRIRQALA